MGHLHCLQVYLQFMSVESSDVEFRCFFQFVWKFYCSTQDRLKCCIVCVCVCVCVLSPYLEDLHVRLCRDVIMQELSCFLCLLCYYNMYAFGLVTANQLLFLTAIKPMDQACEQWHYKNLCSKNI
jgi:hypothetical protein